MIGDTHQMKLGCILIDRCSKVLYVSSNYECESMHLLKKRELLDKVTTGVFKTKNWDKYKITVKRIPIENQMLYMIEILLLL